MHTVDEGKVRRLSAALNKQFGIVEIESRWKFELHTMKCSYGLGRANAVDRRETFAL